MAYPYPQHGTPQYPAAAEPYGAVPHGYAMQQHTYGAPVQSYGAHADPYAASHQHMAHAPQQAHGTQPQYYPQQHGYPYQQQPHGMPGYGHYQAQSPHDPYAQTQQYPGYQQAQPNYGYPLQQHQQYPAAPYSHQPAPTGAPLAAAYGAYSPQHAHPSMQHVQQMPAAAGFEASNNQYFATLFDESRKKINDARNLRNTHLQRLRASTGLDLICEPDFRQITTQLPEEKPEVVVDLLWDRYVGALVSGLIKVWNKPEYQKAILERATTRSINLVVQSQQEYGWDASCSWFSRYNRMEVVNGDIVIFVVPMFYGINCSMITNRLDRSFHISSAK